MCGVWCRTFQSTLPMRGATSPYFSSYSSCEIFQSTLPMRGATRYTIAVSRPYKFQSTLPMRGATEVRAFEQYCRGISIHTPHAGSDYRIKLSRCSIMNFNPHSPCGERHKYTYNRYSIVNNISIHTLHAGSDYFYMV